MADSDSDQPPELVYSSDSEDDNPYGYPPEFDEKGEEWSDQFEDIIKIRILSPFLFAYQFGDDVWNQLLLNIGLLKQDWLSTNEVATPMLSKAVDLMEEIADSVILTLVSVKKRDMAHSLLETLKTNNNNNLETVLPEITDNKLIYQLRNRVADAFVDTNPDQLTAGLLYACHQYDLMVREASEKDAVREHLDKIKEQNKTIDVLKKKGNTEFSARNYIKAIGFYTAGLMRSPFNHVLYANRSQAYLSEGSENWLAVMDARRSIVLDKTYEKAYIRCAFAWQKLNNYEQSMKILRQAERLGLDHKNILPYKLKIQRLLDGKGGDNSPALTNGQHNQQNKKTHLSRLNSDDSSRRDSVSDYSDESEYIEEKQPATEHVAPKPRNTKKKNQVKECVKAASKDKSTAMGSNETPKTTASVGTQYGATGGDTAKTKEVRKKSDSESHKTSFKAPASQNKRTPLEDIRLAAQQGSHYFLGSQPQRAIQQYTRALDTARGLPSSLLSDFPAMDHTVLKYALGSTYIICGEVKDIQDALKIFMDLIETLGNLKLPMAYYGLGQVYYLQARFEESRKQLQKGLKEAPQQKKVCWPCTKTEIEESDKAVLKKKIQHMIVSCQNPPKPDAICRVGKKKGHMDVNIYINNPDIKGFVRVICTASCIIEYHLDCWKKINSDDVKKTSDKELLNSPCSTPDCSALIYTITIYDGEGNVKRKVVGTKPGRDTAPGKAPPKMRMKPSIKTVEKRQERKARRKQRQLEVRTRREEEEAAQRMVQAIESLENKTAEQESAAAQPPVLPPEVDIEKYVTVLKKEDADETAAQIAPRGVKGKKKKKSSKNVMTLGEFVGNQGDEDDDEMYEWEDGDGEHDAFPSQEVNMGIDSFEMPTQQNYYPVLDQENPFSVPECLQDSIEAFERTLGHQLPSNITTYVDHPLVYSESPVAQEEVAPPVQQVYSAYSSDQVDPDPVSHPTNCDTNTREEDSIKDFLFSFFAGVLKEHGPLNIEDVVIKRELEEFPPNAIQLIEEAGGIGQFLSHNIQFAMVEDFICVVKDEPKARQLAQENKKSLVDKYRQELAKSMAIIPGKSKKKRSKKASKEAYSDIPRKVDLKEEDLTSERSWPDSETSGNSETSFVSRASKSIPPFNVNNLLVFRGAQIGAYSADSGANLGQVPKVQLAPFDIGNKMTGDSNFNKDSPETVQELSGINSTVQFGYTGLTGQASVTSGSISGRSSQDIASASNANGGSVFEDNKMVDSKTSDILSDDENYSGRASDTSSVSTRREADQIEGLDYTNSTIMNSISSPFKPTSVNTVQPSKLDQLWNSPLEFSPQTKSVSNKSKKKKNKKNVKAKETEEPSVDVDLTKDLSNSGAHLDKIDSAPSGLSNPQSSHSVTVPVSATSDDLLPATSPGVQPLQQVASPPPSLHTQPVVSSPSSQLHTPPPFSMPVMMPSPGIQAPFPPPPGLVMYPPPNVPPPSFPQGPALVPPPNQAVLTQKDPPMGGPLPTFPPLSPAQLIGQIGSAHGVAPSPASSISSLGSQAGVTRDRALQTDPVAMDWSEVEALMGQLELEKKQLAEKLESERRQRLELAREQGEQMEQIISQMQQQEEKNHIVSKERDQFCLDKSNQQDRVIHLENQVKFFEDKYEGSQSKQSNLEKEVLELKRVIEKDRNLMLQEREEHNNKIKNMSEKYGMDMLRAERAEINILKLKLSLSMKNFEKSLNLAEKEKTVYSEHIKRLDVEGIGVPPELVDVYRNWTVVMDDIKHKQELCKGVFEGQIRQIKGGEKLDSLPCLDVVDPPPIPIRSNTKSEQTQVPRPRTDPSGRLTPGNRQSPVFNAAPGSRSSAYSASSVARGNMPFGMPSQGHSRQLPKKNNFEEIMRSLSSMFPNYRGTDINQFILRLRESRGNTLTGMNLQEIVTSVAGLIVEDSQSRLMNRGVSVPPPSANPWAPRVSLGHGSVTAEEIFEEEEDPCVICHEELTSQLVLKVECGHRFHEPCIRRWMQEQSTCPTCRKHFLLKEDFPSLS